MYRIALSALVLACNFAGCGASTTPTNAPVPEPPVPAMPPQTSNQVPPPEQPRETVPDDDSAASEKITLDLLPWEGVQELIAAHKGKVVVVDLWATYCAPCRAEFPGLVELSHADPENVVCISVSLDDPNDEAKVDAARAFLEEQHATMQNILCTTDSDVLYDEILQIGGIPAVYIYGRDGTLAKVFTGPTPEGTEHTYHEHIAPFVKDLAARN